jgi:hypothetical protein
MEQGRKIILEKTLDPTDWDSMQILGHRMVDDMIDYLKAIRERAGGRRGRGDIAGQVGCFNHGYIARIRSLGIQFQHPSNAIFGKDDRHVDCLPLIVFTASQHFSLGASRRDAIY